MKKKTPAQTTTTTRRASVPASLTAFLDADADPIALAEQLDDAVEFTDDPYIRAYQDLFERFFSKYATPGGVAVRKLMNNIDGAYEIEVAARKAGFVMGLEYARRLLVPAGGVR